MEAVMTENAFLFKDHQQYILEVKENRKKTYEKLSEIEA